jgi:hypothetical protein
MKSPKSRPSSVLVSACATALRVTGCRRGSVGHASTTRYMPPIVSGVDFQGADHATALVMPTRVSEEERWSHVNGNRA